MAMGPADFGRGTGSIVRTGAALSRPMSRLVVARLPARSVTTPVTVCRGPSCRSWMGSLQVATPLPPAASVQVKVIVASYATQPALFAAGDTVAEIVGGVPSIVMVTVTLAVAPLELVATATRSRGPPPAGSTTVAVHVLPLRAAAVPFTVTLATDTSSLDVPVTVTVEVLLNVPAAGEVIATRGGVCAPL